MDNDFMQETYHSYRLWKLPDFLIKSTQAAFSHFQIDRSVKLTSLSEKFNNFSTIRLLDGLRNYVQTYVNFYLMLQLYTIYMNEEYIIVFIYLFMPKESLEYETSLPRNMALPSYAVVVTVMMVSFFRRETGVLHE